MANLNLDYLAIKNNQLIFSCFDCKNNYKKDFNKKLIQRFKNTYEFCDKDIKTLINLFC